MNRVALRLLAGELLDAVYNGAMHPRYANELWLNTTLGLIHMEEWKGILTVSPYYQVGDRTVATDASGLITLAALDTGSADARQHTFRVLEVAINGQPYRYVETKDYPFAANENALERVWLVRGRNVQVPAIRSGSVTALVNYYPCRADLLATDDSEVTFVDGYELLLAYMLAARMGGKGAEEAGAAEYLKGEAEEIRELMRVDIRRLAARPTQPQPQDDVADYEGYL